MTLEEQLEDFILKRYKNLTEFSKASGVPYTTIRSALERGLKRISLMTALKICHTLEISVDAIDNDEIMPKELADMEFNVEEREIIRKYRALDFNAQRRVRRNLDAEYEDAVASLGEGSLNVTGHG